MRLVIVTDAWHPQVNGVVRTLEATGRCLERSGYEVRFVTPAEFRTVPCPTYPEIRLALWPRRRVAGVLDDFAADAVHIATEGPLDVVEHGRVGCLDDDLGRAIAGAGTLDRGACAAYARGYSWERSTATFASYLELGHGAAAIA